MQCPNLYRALWVIELKYVDTLINSAKCHDEWGCCWNSRWEIGVRLFGQYFLGAILVIFQLTSISTKEYKSKCVSTFFFLELETDEDTLV